MSPSSSRLLEKSASLLHPVIRKNANAIMALKLDGALLSANGKWRFISVCIVVHS